MTPGPGEYVQDKSAVQKSLPAYSLKGKTQDLSKLETPGPGAYNQEKDNA